MGFRSSARRLYKCFSFRKSSESARDKLREFVYLDEVSVVSLLASLTGEVTSEVVDALSASEEVSNSASVAASAGVAKAQLDSKFQSTSSQSTQITRKANIQSLFRDLHRQTRDLITLPGDFDIDFLPTTAQKLCQNSSFCVTGESLQRGSLIEVTVELEAAPVFRVSTFMSEMFDISVKHPEVFGTSNLSPEVGAMARVFDRMLTGLVPIQGRCRDLRVFELDGTAYVARNSVLERLDIESRPLFIVGVADQRFFWKDLRRLLFSNSEFKMLCRIERSGIHSDWSPVKLSEVFSNVLPQMGDLSTLMSSMSEQLLIATPSHDSFDVQLSNTLSHFSGQVSEDADVEPSQETTRQVELLIANLARRGRRDLEFQRDAFDAVTTAIGVQLPAQRAAEYRREARLAAGLNLLDDSRPGLEVQARDTPQQDVALLDTEVIAIYW